MKQLAEASSADAGLKEEHFWPSRQYKTRYTVRLPQTLAEQLEAYCADERCDRQTAIERGLRLLFERTSGERASGERTSGRPASGRPVNGRPVTRTSGALATASERELIEVYQQMTGNRVTAKDRVALAEVRHLGPDVVRRGIALAVSRAKSKVDSFRYCLDAIREVASEPR